MSKEDLADTPRAAVLAYAPVGVRVVRVTHDSTASARPQADVRIVLRGEEGVYRVEQAAGKWGVIGGEGCAAGDPAPTLPTDCALPSPLPTGAFTYICDKD
ncbi:hypothetical protein ACFQ3F_22825 [Nocardioides ginsengisoli]|uniref:SH3 domain-containing protein n=1 Tax=Nocardioides ginsengisoli TaxID=363868 RepID=A0ABW3W814_9ACTN